MPGRPWPLLIVGRNMTAGDVDALVYVQTCDEGNNYVCACWCEIGQGMGGVGRPRAGMAGARFNRLHFSSSCITARRRLRLPSNTA